MQKVLFTVGWFWIDWSDPSWYRKLRFWFIGFQHWPKNTSIPHHFTILGLRFNWYGKRTVTIYY